MEGDPLVPVLHLCDFVRMNPAAMRLGIDQVSRAPLYRRRNTEAVILNPHPSVPRASYGRTWKSGCQVIRIEAKGVRASHGCGSTRRERRI